MERWPPRPKLDLAFYKAHGLGNDYLVFEEGDAWSATARNVTRVCDPHRGVGSDGIVVLLADHGDGIHRLRMFNPDGGEFERSGNGLRVLGSFLARRGDVSPYRVSVGGDEVLMSLHGARTSPFDLSVDMGVAAAGPDAVGLDRGALDDEGRLAGPASEPLEVMPVSIGNPHLVVGCKEPTEGRLAQIGPFLSGHRALRAGANVQLAAVVGPRRCTGLIWERGVGRTAASGTSACAIAVAFVASGRIEPGDVVVEMPGGELAVRVSRELHVELRGPIEEVCDGVVAAALVPD